MVRWIGFFMGLFLLLSPVLYPSGGDGAFWHALQALLGSIAGFGAAGFFHRQPEKKLGAGVAILASISGATVVLLLANLSASPEGITELIARAIVAGGLNGISLVLILKPFRSDAKVSDAGATEAAVPPVERVKDEVVPQKVPVKEVVPERAPPPPAEEPVSSVEPSAVERQFRINATLVGLLVLVAVGMSLTIGSEGEDESAAEGSYVAEVIKRHEARLARIPEFQQMVKDAPDISAEAWEEGTPGATPVRWGLLRLSDAELEESLRLRQRLTAKMPEAVCADHARGRPSRKETFAAMDQLDSASVERWFDLAYRAFIAEVNKSPPAVTVTDEEVEAAWEVVLEQQPTEDTERFFAIAESPGAATSTDLCWLQNTYYRFIFDLPPEHRRVLVRSEIQQRLAATP